MQTSYVHSRHHGYIWFPKRATHAHTHQQDALPGHPAYRQHGSALDSVVVAAVQVPAHAEVGDLDGELSVQEAVPRGQISMHKVQRRQVLHP